MDRKRFLLGLEQRSQAGRAGLNARVISMVASGNAGAGYQGAGHSGLPSVLPFLSPSHVGHSWLPIRFVRWRIDSDHERWRRHGIGIHGHTGEEFIAFDANTK
jgi:hypothetical protein